MTIDKKILLGVTGASGSIYADRILQFLLAQQARVYLVVTKSGEQVIDHELGRDSALVRILKKANVDFAILGCEEKCTGDPARRMGNEYLYNQLVTENIETLKQHKFKKIFAKQ